MRRFLVGVLSASCLLAAGAPPAAADLPPVRHVFVIVLENKGFEETFRTGSQAPYLGNTLPLQGQLLSNYFGIAHVSLPNYIAMISGQAPNPQTQADCLQFTEMQPGTLAADGQAVGQGCVYPAPVKTLADQLPAKGRTWKGYMEDMGNSQSQPKTCRHPSIGAPDDTQLARAGDEYAVRHNPFVYFHSIIDSPACAANDLPLERLPADLRSETTAPNFSMIIPNLCNDAHDPSETSTSKNCKTDGKPGGLVRIDPFLRRWVPLVLASPAYRSGGLLIITFDEARWSNQEGGESNPDSQPDASACCNEMMGPNTLNAGGPIPGPGGGRTGAVLISPWIRPGTINATSYNHYGLLRSVEDIFGLDHLGYAAQVGLQAFGRDVFNAGPADITSLVVKPAKVRAGGRGGGVARKRKRKLRRAGATVSYKVSQPALVSFRAQRGRRGSLVRGRCVTRKRRRRARQSCRRWTGLRGSFTQQAITGTNSFRFTGRLAGRRLRPAHYRLVARARGWGGAGRTARRRFRVVKR
jgi:phosphatidylinositol-3-phosphatase